MEEEVFDEDNAVTPYKCLDKISDILYLNNENNQLERQVRPSQRCSFKAPSRGLEHLA